MNFSMRGLTYNILLLLFTICATLTLLLANVGSIKKNKGATSIFFLELNFSDKSFSEVVPSVGSEMSTSENVYTFGMYGYCRGKSTENESSKDKDLYAVDFNVDSCTDPKALYVFDPEDFIQTEVRNQTGYKLTDSEIKLPSKIESYLSTARTLSKATYITSCAAIALSFITFILTFVMFFTRPGFSIFPAVIEIVAFVAAILTSGCATGMYKYIQIGFNDAYSTYGIKAKLSRNFLILTWFGTGMTAIIALMLLVNGCVGCCGPAFGRINRRDIEYSRPNVRADVEEKEAADFK